MRNILSNTLALAVLHGKSLDMASQTNKVRAKLTSLNTSLGELESLLEPLLAKSLSESTLELEPLQKAKLQTVLPYVAYDLIFSEFLIITRYGILTFGSIPQNERRGPKNTPCDIRTCKHTLIFIIAGLKIL